MDLLKRRAPMRVSLLALLTTLLLTSAPSVSAAPEEAPTPFSMRGVFVDAFGTQFRNHLNTMRLANDLIDYEARYCFLQVVGLGQGFYKSELLPRPAGMPIGYDDPLGDLMGALKEREDHNIRIIAWINPLRSYNDRAILQPAEGHVTRDHPEWLTVDFEGNRADDNGWVYLDPGNPEARQHVIDVVMEIVKNYDVEGVLLDGLQYPQPGARFGYNEKPVERFQEETGMLERPDPYDPIWLNWRRRQINSLLASITEEVKKYDESLIVAATANAEGVAPGNADGFQYASPFVVNLQDWMTWARFGLADWLVLLNFCDEQTEANRFDRWTKFAVDNENEAKTWVAVAGYRNWAIDAFRQVQRARALGADGIATFNFRQPVRDIATAGDYFAAVRSVSMMGEIPGTEALSTTPGLAERVQRMAQALEPEPHVQQPQEDEGVELPEAGDETMPGTDAETDTEAPIIPPFHRPWDTIHLRNSSVFEGHKIGELADETIFETKSGIIIKINDYEIERIARGGRDAQP